MGRVLHSSGPYEGMEIDYIVEVDPAYILEVATTTRHHGIDQSAINRARQLLDRWQEEDYEDDALEELRESGYHFVTPEDLGYEE